MNDPTSTPIPLKYLRERLQPSSDLDLTPLASLQTNTNSPLRRSVSELSMNTHCNPYPRLHAVTPTRARGTVVMEVNAPYSQIPGTSVSLFPPKRQLDYLNRLDLNELVNRTFHQNSDFVEEETGRKGAKGLKHAASYGDLTQLDFDKNEFLLEIATKRMKLTDRSRENVENRIRKKQETERSYYSDVMKLYSGPIIVDNNSQS